MPVYRVVRVNEALESPLLVKTDPDVTVLLVYGFRSGCQSSRPRYDGLHIGKITSEDGL